MRQRRSGAVLPFSLAALLLAAAAGPAVARSHHHAHGHLHHTRMARAGGAHVIQCVAFARSDSGVQLAGNAANWWDNAAGLYARGAAPEVGSVLNFRANSRMRLGHVAVVSAVLNGRQVLIDQSHWASGGVSRDISVIDVSPDNSWTAVRVAIGHESSYGSIYPTYGFIYARPDNGVTVASTGAVHDAVAFSPAHVADAWRQRREATLEVADAPENAHAIDLSATGVKITAAAPDRAFR